MELSQIMVDHVKPEKLSTYLSIDLPENQELTICNFAVMDSHFIIETDACFSEIGYPYHYEGKIQPVIEIVCFISHWNPDRTQCTNCINPDFIKIIPLEDYLQLSEKKKLIEFVRWDYNGRIKQNQKLLIEELNKYLSQTQKTN